MVGKKRRSVNVLYGNPVPFPVYSFRTAVPNRSPAPPLRIPYIGRNGRPLTQQVHIAHHPVAAAAHPGIWAYGHMGIVMSGYAMKSPGTSAKSIGRIRPGRGWVRQRRDGGRVTSAPNFQVQNRMPFSRPYSRCAFSSQPRSSDGR